MASHEGRVEAILLRGMPVEDIRANPTIRDNVLAGSLAALRPGSNNVAIGSRLAELLGLSRRQLDHRSSRRRAGRRRSARCRGSSTTRSRAIFEVGALRFRQGVRDHADGGGAEFPDDGRFGRHDRGHDRRCRPGRRDPRAARRRGRQPGDRQRLAVDELGLVRGDPGRAGGRCSCVLSIIILVAAFNILSSLIMLVRAKTRDIAILRTMGATPARRC